MTNARSTGLAAVAMAWCAGFVDAACYVRLYRTYTSHITGNTASLAFRAVGGEWAGAAHLGWAIGSFLLGLFVSAILQQMERREGIRSAFAMVLGLEILLLALFIRLSGSPTTPLAVLIFLPAAAMGMQTVTVTRVGRLRVYTTYLTGNLSRFSEAVTGYLFWAWEHSSGAFPGRLIRMLRVTPRHETLRQAAITAGIWTAFLAGAVSAVAADAAWGAIALVAPMGVLAVLAMVDLRRPMAIGDKGEEE